MRLQFRGPWRGPAVVVLGILLAGCGGSIADADAPAPSRVEAAPSSPFCTAVDANAAAIRPLNGLRGNVTADQLAADVDAVRRSGADLLNAAPGEVRADVQRTVDAVNLQLDALVAAGGDAAAAGRQPELTRQLSAPDLTAANRRLGEYVTENCR